MKLFNKYIAVAALAFVGFGCEPDLEEELIKADAGSADFTKYVSVGNSLTAGFADAGLYRDAQTQSFPSMLATSFGFAGGGTFTQPLMTGNGPTGHSFLIRVDTNPATGAPIPVLGGAAPTAADAAPLTGTFNNIGVPGIRVSDVTTAGYGSSAGNIFFNRMVQNTNPFQTYVEFVAQSNPTFFTCWLGNNDVLGFATSGGDGSSPITSEAIFRSNYEEVMTALTQTGAKGVVATIPNVTDIPFFTTANASLIGNGVPLGGFPLDATTAAQLNGAYQLAGYNSPGFVAGINTFAIVTEGRTVRQFDPSRDVLTLAAVQVATQFATGLGTITGTTPSPIPDVLVLDRDEIEEVAVATEAFNKIIRSYAADDQIAVWDANAFFSEFVIDGFVDGAVSMDARYINGLAFSLDGVHPTPRGYALIANKFLETIEEEFGSVLPRAEYAQFRTIKTAD